MAGIPGIIYPPTLDFDYLVQRPQQLLKALSQLGVTVYFFNRDVHCKEEGLGVERYHEHLYLFHQHEFYYPQHIRPVVYYSNPTQVRSISSYNPILRVFDSLDEAVDEFSSWQPYYHQAVASADLVLAASDKLYSRARQINPCTVLLPNGCDYDYFRQAGGRRIRPLDLPELKGHVIGYMGVVASWCDLELLDELAAALPDCSFLIIGPLYNVHDVPLRSNLHWLGYKDYDELIDYVGYFDVGIIPFKTSTMTEAVNPIKMWEYLALGIPVVATALPEVSKYGNLVYCSAGREEFISHTRQALQDKSENRREQRMALARENSWPDRARQMLEAIEARFQAQGIKTREGLPAPPGATAYRRRNYHAPGRVKYPGVKKFKLSLAGG